MTLSNEERRALALQEAYASRTSGTHAVATLEINHSLIDDPVYVVADNQEMKAKLESGATVTFLPVAFRAVPPAQNDGRWPEINLAIDGAADIIEPVLDQVIGSDQPVTVVFREYLRGNAMDGPANIISGLELDRSSASDLTVTGVAGFYGLDRKFGKTYDPSEYPFIV